jgi:hypothetical protein
MGWENKLNSSEAVEKSIDEMLLNAERIYGKS